jgi:hypothetical protein
MSHSYLLIAVALGLSIRGKKAFWLAPRSKACYTESRLIDF